MRKFVLALAALLFSSSAQAHVSAVPFPEIGSLRDVTHQSAFAIFQTYAGPPQIACTITDVGNPCASPAATCNGVADDAIAFKAFNTWARANQGASNQVVLTIPTGKTCIFNTSQTSPLTTCCALGNAWTAGINNLIVEGTGATIGEGSSGYWLGGVGICNRGLAASDGCSARLQTVSAGSSTVTLTSASLSAGYVSRFAIGQWVLVGGVDIQGQWATPGGFPPNFKFFEYRQVINVNGGTGVITLDRPLTNSYKSTWPNYNAGSAGEADQGGPATIYAVGTSGNYWASTLDFRGLTFTRPVAQIYAAGRYVTYRNATFTGLAGAIPTQNETWSCYTCNWSNASAQMEVDKLIGTMVMDQVTIPRIDFQSSSTDLLVMTNSTVSGAMFGSANASQVTDSVFGTLRPGATSYGISTGAFVCTRCTATTFQAGGLAQDSRNPSEWTMSSGVITVANTSIIGSGPLSRIMVPGGNIWFTTNGSTETSLGNTFQVTDLTQDATNVYIQTSQAGAQPPIGSFSGASYVTFRTVPVGSFTCINCLGDPLLVQASSQKSAPAAIPIFTYAKQDYAPTTSGALQSMKGTGNITSITVAVTQNFTGSGSGTLNLAGQFHNFTIKQSNWTSFDWVPTIELKTAGTRVITGAGVTCNGSPGACAGDTNLTLPEAVWFQDGLGPFMSGNLSGGGTLPLFTITVQTDQHVVP